jgi:hypothetical protein
MTSILDLIAPHMTSTSDPVAAPIMAVLKWDLDLPALAAAAQHLTSYINLGAPIVKRRGGALCPKGTSGIWSNLAVAATLASKGDSYSIRNATYAEQAAIRGAISVALAGELPDDVRRVLTIHLEISNAWSPPAPHHEVQISGKWRDRYDPSSGGRDVH